MIPTWAKRNSLYPRARVSMLSILSRPRFYSPMSAFAMCDSPEAQPSGVDSVRVVRREGGCAIWETPLGEIATMDTECADHIAFLVAEVKRAVYSSDQITMPQDAVVLDVGANIGLFTREALRHGAKRVISVELCLGIEALRTMWLRILLLGGYRWWHPAHGMSGTLCHFSLTRNGPGGALVWMRTPRGSLHTFR